MREDYYLEEDIKAYSLFKQIGCVYRNRTMIIFNPRKHGGGGSSRSTSNNILKRMYDEAEQEARKDNPHRVLKNPYFQHVSETRFKNMTVYTRTNSLPPSMRRKI